MSTISEINFHLYNSSIAGQPILGIYAELINYSKSSFKFLPASKFGCIPSSIYFNPPLQHQSVTIGVTSFPYSYTFTNPTVCGLTITLTPSMKVDKYTTIPTFMDIAWGGLTSNLNLNPTSSDVGVYTVRIRFEFDSDATTFEEQTFFVEVYPNPQFGSNVTTASCTEEFYPMVLYQNGLYITWIEAHPGGNGFLVSGSTNNWAALTTSFTSGIVISFSPDWQVNFNIVLEKTMDSVAQVCNYAETGYIIFSTRTKTDATGIFKDIVIYKYTDMVGKLVKAVQLKSLTDDFQLEGQGVDTATPAYYITGYHQLSQFKAYSNSYPECFVIKLNATLDIQWTMSFNAYQTNTYGLRLVASTTLVYVGFYIYLPSYARSQPGYVQLSASTAGLQQGRVWFNTNAHLIYQSELKLTSTGIYVCFLSRQYYPSTSTGEEAIIVKFDQALNLQYNYEIGQIGGTRYCTVMQDPASTYVMIIVSHQSGVNLYFRLSQTLALDSSIPLLSYSNGNYDVQKVFLLKNPTGIFFVHDGYYTTNQRYFSIYRMPTPSTWAWYKGCTQFQYVNQNSWTQGTFSNINDYTTGYWQSSFNYYQNVNLLNELNFMKSNPDNVKLIYRGATLDPKGYDTGNCYTVVTPQVVYQTNYTGSINGIIVDSAPVSMLLKNFTHCQGSPIAYTWIQNNGAAIPSWMVFNAGPILQVTITANSNSFVGIYTIKMTGTNSYQNTKYVFTTFQIEILKNDPPLLIPIPVSKLSQSMFAWQSITNNAYQIGSDDKFNVAFLDSIIENSSNVPLSPQPSWFTYNNATQDKISMKIIQPPQPATGQNTVVYFIRIRIWDEFNVATPRTTDLFQLTVNRNYAPQMNSPYLPNTLPSTTIPWGFNYTFYKQNFTDAEGDSFTITCTNTTTATGSSSWAKFIFTVATGNITLYGTPPPSNIYSGTYSFNCQVKDSYDGTPTTYSITQVVFANQQIQITNPANRSIRRPFSTVFDVSSLVSDPEQQTFWGNVYFNSTLSINGTSFLNWVQWDMWNNVLTIAPTNNSQGGNHTITIQYDDTISNKANMTFMLEIVFNFPLQVQYYLQNKAAIADNPFNFTIDPNELLLDPENEAFFMYITSQGSDSLPYFIFRNFSNGTFQGFVTSDDIGDYQLECVGVDYSNEITRVPFLLSIKPCYFKCATCWDFIYNTCTNCKDGYFLLKAECLDVCPDGYFHNYTSKSCVPCPNDCSQCSGQNQENQCQKCKQGIYYLNNGCYKKCPKGYWGDRTTYTCRLCNQACNDCYGASASECYNCTEVQEMNELQNTYKKGYLYSNGECRIPKCAQTQYFQWNPTLTNGIHLGKCISCHPTCLSCLGPLNTQCLLCPLGYRFDNYKCRKCEEYEGFFTNNELNCEEICGDGIFAGQKDCDDGNVIDNDGCSSKCVLEQGYICNINGTLLCKEIVPPTFSITQVTVQNSIWVEFSEGIMIQQNTTISDTNMEIKVSGPREPYSFTWRIVPNADIELVPDRIIKKFQIILENFQQALEGNYVETVKITFIDNTQIEDLADNTLEKTASALGYLNKFDYISDSANSTMMTSGQSLKYTFISVFSFQVIIKVVLQSSMNYLWSLVHALQIFNYLLYINIDFPPNIAKFNSYLSVATGDISELTTLIPDVSDYVIQKQDVNQTEIDQEKLPNRFLTIGVVPYFLIAFGRTFTMWIAIFCVFLPILMILRKLCHKVKFFEELTGAFFFNGPLRAITELYVDISFALILNSKFTKFANYSQAITTLIAVVFGGGCLLLPFILMSLIYANRRNVRRRTWQLRFGMLTDELNSKSILQLYYYPLFLFQRLVIIAIIVYLPAYPVMQCFGIMCSNILMIAYMIINRPFKEENQQTTTVLDEIVIMLVLCCFLSLIFVEMSQETKLTVGWVIVILILLSVVKNFGIVIYFGFIKAKKTLRDLFDQESNQKDSPSTSDNKSVTLDSVQSEEERKVYGKDKHKSKQNEKESADGLRALNTMDQRILRDIQRENQVLNTEEVLAPKSFSAFETPGNKNPYPSMIYIPGAMDN